MTESHITDLSSLNCPNPDCPGKLSYVRSKTNADKSVRVWRRKCNICGLEVVDSAIYRREITAGESVFMYRNV